MTKELTTYGEFVTEVTSAPSLDTNRLIARIVELNNNTHGVNIARLMTGSDGLVAEGGEFKEVVKKILYQGASLDEHNIFHMKRELGDVFFYWITAVLALGENPMEVIEENVRKLESRYPGGKFSIHHSENRQEGDL